MNNVGEMNFNPRSFFLKKDYLEAGCPVRYFEFAGGEYYGLVAVQKDLFGMTDVEIAMEKIGVQLAYEVYLRDIGGESVEELKKEFYPREISKAEALLKFLLAPNTLDYTVESLIKSFEETKSGALLVDGNL